jgi:hypothetical protein
MQGGATPTPTPKTRTWNMPTVLSLILGGAGTLGLIALRPQISVSPLEPIEKSQPFSVPFSIDNSGYLSFYVENAFCYVDKVKLATTGHFEGNGNLIVFNDLTSTILEPGGGEAPICYLVKGPIQEADIVVVIDYKPRSNFPHSFRTYRGFKGAYIDNWQWVRFPVSADITAKADSRIDAYFKDKLQRDKFLRR